MRISRVRSGRAFWGPYARVCLSSVRAQPQRDQTITASAAGRKVFFFQLFFYTTNTQHKTPKEGKQDSRGKEARGKEKAFRGARFTRAMGKPRAGMSCQASCGGGPARETIGSSRPQKALLKLRKTRISRSKQLRREVRLCFLCVFLGRQGPPRPARRRTRGKNATFLFCATQAHARARPAAPSRGTRRNQTANTHAARRQLYSQIVRASCARSRERASSA